MRRVRHRDGTVACVDLVTPPLVVPVLGGGHHPHLLDDVPPADPRVVGAEGDLPLLGAVGDDAHLRAAEVVVPEVLEPHAEDRGDAPLARLGRRAAR